MMPDADSLRHKYAPIPDEPRYKKRAKKVHVRSDHKHLYEEVCVDSHSEVFEHGARCPAYHVAMRCVVCGRLQDLRMWRLRERPEGMRLFEVEDFFELLDMRELPDEMEVRE